MSFDREKAWGEWKRVQARDDVFSYRQFARAWIPKLFEALDSARAEAQKEMIASFEAVRERIDAKVKTLETIVDAEAYMRKHTVLAIEEREDERQRFVAAVDPKTWPPEATATILEVRKRMGLDGEGRK